ncbi:MAG: DEAD/DEAH box helicase ['Candidatus Kapabacteria' thiocyanatum]|uniref:DEAD-box ATP-dependent RNA helicase RhpA n=1 Tax=Candidatus Kapaibacterium thiocyanatum TaxID=1895771 RepID=A0A1M3KXV3_9BACT|nr:DEAD/DEAH box helicase ['Candidatus Kapabacteria' thiocyanatum]OJX57084.1 MAG: DEAD/DEAH box helicase ['Candidatus Kapabacteria' thiocyanatum]
MTFSDLSLIDPILRALEAEGYSNPTPIQQQAIPPCLEGKDLFGCAQTGTGKTAAFALPILQRLGTTPFTKGPRALILAPTRELAHQISDSFRTYGKFIRFRHAVVYGGVSSRPQIDALRRGVDVLIATPGRLLDLIEQRALTLERVEVLVLDEADRMLDMGFITDIRRIMPMLPKERQTLFFSATVPNEIKKLSNDLLRDPVHVEVAPQATTMETIEQLLYFVNKLQKRELLAHLLEHQIQGSVLVFTRTKHNADRVVKDLERTGVRAEALHGDKSQQARQRALRNFKERRTRVLVATDIAARGIDIDDLAFVVNYELPDSPENYVHRIGRTGRAGASGTALSLCSPDEQDSLHAITRLIRRRIPVVKDHPFSTPEHEYQAPQQRSSGGQQRQGGQYRRSSAPYRSGSGSGSHRTRRH